MFAREIHYIEDIPATIADEAKLQEYREKILGGDVLIARRFISVEKIVAIRRYLEGIGKHSLPNYHLIPLLSNPNLRRLQYLRAQTHRL